MGNNKNDQGISDQSFFAVIALVVVAGIGKSMDKIEAWFYQHWFMLSVIAVGTICGIIKFLQWRWRMKNPESYERELAIKTMQKRQGTDSFFEQGGVNSNPARNVINVGRTLKDRKSLTLTNRERTGHVQIVGATGRGKTQSVILPWFIQDLKNDSSPVLIDGKGDEELAQKIEAFVKAGRYGGDYKRFDLANPSQSCAINPLEGGTAQEVADRLISSLEFESSYFRDVQHQVLLMLMDLMNKADREFTFESIYLCLTDSSELGNVIKSCGEIREPLKNEVLKFQSLSPRDKEERFSGLVSQIRPFAVGELAQIVNGKKESKGYLSLEDLMKRKNHKTGQATVILLNTLRHQKAAKILGKIILQTLAWGTSLRKGDERFTPIFLDEFSSFVYDGFELFLNKSRSYNVALHLSHQSLGDLEKISPSFMKTVNVNTNIKCLLGLNDPDTADHFAKHLGTKRMVKQTERGIRGSFGGLERTGDMSLRDVNEYKIHPNRLRNYSLGQGVLSLLVHGIPVTEEVQFDSYHKYGGTH